MRRFALYLFIYVSMFCVAQAQAQDDAKQRQVYAQAENDYQIGRTEQARDSLLLHLKTFQGTLRENALRLIALTYLENFDTKQTESYAGMLLKQNPYYTVSSQDPPEFADIIARMKAAMTVTVTTASSQAETIEEAPLPVTLITEEMIRNCGARDLRELLTNYVPGMVAVDSNDPTIALRYLSGDAQDMMLVMLNGHRLNNYSSNVGRLDYSMSLDKVKRIEVVRGPASSLYGGSAYTGVVNIITKTGGDIDGLQVGVAAGNHSQLKASALFGKSLPYLDIMAWANVHKTGGQTSPYDYIRSTDDVRWIWHGDITTGVYNHKPAMDFGVVARWKRLTFMHNTHSSNHVVPMDANWSRPYDYTQFPSIDGNKPGISLTGHHTSLSFDYQEGPWTLAAGIDYDVSKDMQYRSMGDSADVIIMKPFNDPEEYSILWEENIPGVYYYKGWSSNNLMANLKGAWSYTVADSHQGTITLGLQSARYNFSGYQEYQGVNRSRIVDSQSDWRVWDHHEKNFSSFLQVKHQWRSLIANVGVRYDHVKRRTGIINNELSPRMALIFMQPRWGVKLCYSKSFVAVPTVYRLHSYSEDDHTDHLPEYSWCWQLTLWGKQMLKGLNAEVNVYHSTAENLLSTMGYTNSGKMRSIGVEASLDYTHGKFRCLANASLKRIIENKVNADDNEDRLFVLGDPTFMANATVSYQLLPRLSLHANAHYLGKRNLVNYDYPYLIPLEELESSNEEWHKEVPGEMILDFGVNWSWKNLGVNVNIHNLLGTQYWQSSEHTYYNLPQQRRWFLVELTYKI